MAAVLGNFDDDDDFEEAHDINVTPFIDVMLVLLIIFMVAAPLSTVDLPVDLPSSTAMPQQRPDKPTFVTIKADLAVAISETPVKRVELVSTLDSMSAAADWAGGKEHRIFLRADRAVPYGELMDVLERLRIGGYHQIALVALEGVPGDPSPSGPAGALTMAGIGARYSVATAAASRSVWILAATRRGGASCCRCRGGARRRCGTEHRPGLGAPAIEIGVD